MTGISFQKTLEKVWKDILEPLGLALIPLNTPVSHLSGGQKTRLQLARLKAMRVKVKVGDKAPGFTLMSILGKPVSLKGWLRFSSSAP